MMGEQAAMADGSGWLERLASRERGVDEQRASLRPRLPYAFESPPAPPGYMAPPTPAEAGTDSALDRAVAVAGDASRAGRAPAAPSPLDAAGHAGAQAPPRAPAHADARAGFVNGAALAPQGAGRAPVAGKERHAPAQAPMPGPAAAVRAQARPVGTAPPALPDVHPAPLLPPAAPVENAGLPRDALADTPEAAGGPDSLRSAPAPGNSGSAPPMRAAGALRAPLAPYDASPSEPVIEIHIGRIDITAQSAPAEKKSAQGQAQPASDALAAYLNRRSRGARS